LLSAYSSKEVTFEDADLPVPQFGFRMTWKSDREASGS